MLDPIERFRATFTRAAEQAGDTDPTAATLATSDTAGQPSARIVLVKEYDAAGFRFYTNYRSRKADQLATNPRAALLFFWPQIGAQVRIEGPVERLQAAESDAYWAARPRPSQLGAWASEQSAALDSRETLIRRLESFEERFSGGTVPRPPHWGGYRLAPVLIEFWFNGEHRLHDRFEYRREADSWVENRLNP